MLDLSKDYDSYLFGFILSDGSISFHTQNRGRVKIELDYKDKDIIENIYSKFYYKSYITSRIRDTNFKNDYKTIIWGCYQLEFREQLLELGIPSTNKTNLADVPRYKYNKSAFWRGYIDGDGSIGMTKDNSPFVSITITSERLAAEYFKFLKEEFNIIKIINRNKRDNVYNITIKNEDAINVGNYLYKDSTIKMDRKYNKFLEFNSWKRTKKKINSRTWSSKEDIFILNNSLEESMSYLNRTEQSIKMRLWRLKNKLI